MSLDSFTRITETITETSMDELAADPLPRISMNTIEWINAQKAAGKTAEFLLGELCGGGWDELLARQVLGLPEVPQPAPRSPIPLPPAPQPGPDLRAMPGRIDVGDCEVEVLMTMALPRAVLFGGVLSRYECAALIAAARERGLERSKVMAHGFDGQQVDTVRTSEGMYFQRGENELIQRIEARLARLLHWPVERGESIQVLHYGPGNQYEPHHDYFQPDAASTPSALNRGGQRLGTMILYLADTEAGGGTVFPDSGLSIMPRCGNALFFGYEQPDPATRTRHGGAPVFAGEKWIATKWLRERAFE